MIKIKNCDVLSSQLSNPSTKKRYSKYPTYSKITCISSWISEVTGLVTKFGIEPIMKWILQYASTMVYFRTAMGEHGMNLTYDAIYLIWGFPWYPLLQRNHWRYDMLEYIRTHKYHSVISYKIMSVSAAGTENMLKQKFIMIVVWTLFKMHPNLWVNLNNI